MFVMVAPSFYRFLIVLGNATDYYRTNWYKRRLQCGYLHELGIAAELGDQLAKREKGLALTP